MPWEGSKNRPFAVYCPFTEAHAGGNPASALNIRRYPRRAAAGTWVPVPSPHARGVWTQGFAAGWRPASFPANGRRAACRGAYRLREETMDHWLELTVFLLMWIALQIWVLPRLGIPT